MKQYRMAAYHIDVSPKHMVERGFYVCSYPTLNSWGDLLHTFTPVETGKEATLLALFNGDYLGPCTSDDDWFPVEVCPYEIRAFNETVYSEFRLVKDSMGQNVGMLLRREHNV